MWVVRVGEDDGGLRPWHYICVYSIESRLIMKVTEVYAYSIEIYVYSIESRLIMRVTEEHVYSIEIYVNRIDSSLIMRVTG